MNISLTKLLELLTTNFTNGDWAFIFTGATYLISMRYVNVYVYEIMFKYFAFCETVQQHNIILSFLDSTWLFSLLDHLLEMFRLTLLGIYWNLLQPILKYLIFSYDIWNFDQWCVLFVDSFCLFVILRAGKFVTFVAKRMNNTSNYFKSFLIEYFCLTVYLWFQCCPVWFFSVRFVCFVV